MVEITGGGVKSRDEINLRGHPVDVLEAIAHQAGRELDPAYAAEMRALCDEPVPVPGVYSADQARGFRDEAAQLPRKGDWMQTASGRQYWPLDPRPDDVDPLDIAHHLSMLCRYCGACLQFWSVAEHSVGVLHVIERDMMRSGIQFGSPLARKFRLAALLHDAPESYCHDLIRPIKRSVHGYDQVEAANADAVAVRFDLPRLSEIDANRIKQADNAMLLAEQEALMAPAPAKWAPIVVPDAMLNDARYYVSMRLRFVDRGPEQAKALFLTELDNLTA